MFHEVFTASRLWLISAPSMRVCLSVSVTSEARSLPARSMKDILRNKWIHVKYKVKVQTVLKSSKLLHEQTIYLLIYVHACILCALWCKKARYCEGKFDVFFEVIGIRDI